MTDPVLFTVAAQVAGRYARRVWYADERDLRQEAMVACLKASTTWCSTVGVPLRAYAWRAAVLHLRMYCWRQSAPVSETWHRVETLAGVHSADISTLDFFPEDRPDPGELVDDARFRQRVRAQVEFVLRETLGELDGKLATAALIDDASAPPKLVTKARRALRNNFPLYQMHKHGDWTP